MKPVDIDECGVVTNLGRKKWSQGRYHPPGPSEQVIQVGNLQFGLRPRVSARMAFEAIELRADALAELGAQQPAADEAGVAG